MTSNSDVAKLVERLRRDDDLSARIEAADALESLTDTRGEDMRELQERCAKVADDARVLAHDGLDLTGFGGVNSTCRSIAAAIRSLPIIEGDDR